MRPRCRVPRLEKKGMATTFASASTRGHEDKEQDQNTSDLSASSRDLGTHYTWRNTQQTLPLCTRDSTGHQFTLECLLTVLSICNLRPSEWKLFTVPIRYPRYTFPLYLYTHAYIFLARSPFPYLRLPISFLWILLHEPGVPYFIRY